MGQKSSSISSFRPVFSPSTHSRRPEHSNLEENDEAVSINQFDFFCGESDNSNAGIIESITYQLQEIQKIFERSFFTTCVEAEEFKNFCVAEFTSYTEGRIKSIKDIIAIENVNKYMIFANNINEINMLKTARCKFIAYMKRRKLYTEEFKNKIIDFLRSCSLNVGVFNINVIWVIKDRHLSKIRESSEIALGSYAKVTSAPYGRYHVGVQVGSFFVHYCFEKEKQRGYLDIFSKQQHPLGLGKYFLKIPLFYISLSKKLLENIMNLYLSENVFDFNKKLRRIAKEIFDQSNMCYTRDLRVVHLSDIVKNFKKCTDKWKGMTKYSDTSNNCQTFLFDALYHIGLQPERNKIPYSMVIIDLESKKAMIRTFSEALMNFMKKMYLNPKNIHFDHLKIEGSDPTVFVELIKQVKGNIEKLDPLLLSIAAAYYFFRGKFFKRKKKKVICGIETNDGRETVITKDVKIDLDFELIMNFYVKCSNKFHESFLPKLSEFDLSRVLKTVHLDENEYLGEGTFGKVFEIKYHRDMVAAFKMFFVNPMNQEMVVNEVKAIAKRIYKLSHPNLTKFVGYSTYYRKFNLSKNQLCLNRVGIISELCSKNSVAKALFLTSSPLSLKKGIQMLIDVANGVNALHKEEVCHNDLKWDNVISGIFDKSLKLCDFGSVRFVSNKEGEESDDSSNESDIISNEDDSSISNDIDEKKRPKARYGTKWYADPRLVEKRDSNFDKYSDAFSFGLMIYEIIFLEEIRKYQKDKNYDPRKKFYSKYFYKREKEFIKNPTLRPFIFAYDIKVKAIVDLMKSCWNVDVKKRPSFKVIINVLTSFYAVISRKESPIL